jgi:DNA-directed RNA polymerase subunit RPC12/RpoP
MRQKTRDIEEIMADMGKLLSSPDLQTDLYGGEKFRDLYFEELEACGIDVLETRCRRCGHPLDHASLEESDWTFELAGTVMLVVYTCPECGEKTPQNLAIPEGSPDCN